MSAPPSTPWLRRLPRRVPAPAPAPASAPPRVTPAVPTVAPAPAAPPRVALSAPQPSAPPAPAPTSAPTSPAPSGGLTRLSAPEPAAPRPAAPPREPALTLIPPPGVVGTVTLDADDPVVRLDAVQSGIGTLEIRGGDRVAWEAAGDRSGVVATGETSTGDDVPEPGNRPLVGLHEGSVLVALRHVRTLRRLLIDAAADTAVTVTAAMGGTVRAADPDRRVRISVVAVDGRLELRVEQGLPEEWRAALAAMGWSSLAAIPR